jgi:hypothetical protein
MRSVGLALQLGRNALTVETLYVKLIRAGHPAEGSIYGRRKPDSGKIPCQPSGRAYKHFEVGLLSEGDLPYDPYAAPIHRYGLV